MRRVLAIAPVLPSILLAPAALAEDADAGPAIAREPSTPLPELDGGACAPPSLVDLEGASPP